MIWTYEEVYLPLILISFPSGETNSDDVALSLYSIDRGLVTSGTKPGKVWPATKAKQKRLHLRSSMMNQLINHISEEKKKKKKTNGFEV